MHHSQRCNVLQHFPYSSLWLTYVFVLPLWTEFYRPDIEPVKLPHIGPTAPSHTWYDELNIPRNMASSPFLKSIPNASTHTNRRPRQWVTCRTVREQDACSKCWPPATQWRRTAVPCTVERRLQVLRLAGLKLAFWKNLHTKPVFLLYSFAQTLIL